MINKAIIVGRLGRDPEQRQTQGGKPITHLNVATSESWKDRTTGERKEKTEWHRVVIFNEALARMSGDKLQKGDLVYLEGQIQTRKWQANDGSDRYSTEIVLPQYGSTMRILDGGKSPPKAVEKEPDQDSFGDDLDDEIPF